MVLPMNAFGAGLPQPALRRNPAPVPPDTEPPAEKPGPEGAEAAQSVPQEDSAYKSPVTAMLQQVNNYLQEKEGKSLPGFRQTQA